MSMIQSNKASKEIPWDLFIDTLQEFRGQGQWRGKLIQLRKQHKLRLEMESKGKKAIPGEIEILLSSEWEKIMAHSSPKGEEFYLKDHRLNVKDFLAAILTEIRQGTYIHTHKDKAHYRN